MAVVATDSAGNATTVTNTFTVDATPPVITVTSPAVGNVGTLTPVLTFNIADAHPDTAQTVVSLNGVVIPNPVSGTTTLSPQPVGTSNILTIAAGDGAGNTTSKSVTFTVILADGRVVSLGASSPTIADALMVLGHSVGLITLTPDQFSHADVAPLDPVTGIPAPNGTVNIADALIILKKVVGLVTTF